jgi:hypothetical protein
MIYDSLLWGQRLSGFECGKCKKAFPQHIPDREKLIEVREFRKNWFYKKLVIY